MGAPLGAWETEIAVPRLYSPGGSPFAVPSGEKEKGNILATDSQRASSPLKANLKEYRPQNVVGNKIIQNHASKMTDCEKIGLFFFLSED